MDTSIPLRMESAPTLDRRARALSGLRISVIDRCNFRCPYCMPEDDYPRDHQFLSKSGRLRFEEIERLARIFAGLGVRKLRLTGGTYGATGSTYQGELETFAKVTLTGAIASGASSFEVRRSCGTSCTSSCGNWRRSKASTTSR